MTVPGFGAAKPRDTQPKIHWAFLLSSFSVVAVAVARRVLAWCAVLPDCLEDREVSAFIGWAGVA
jgi:hypothetical protein